MPFKVLVFFTRLPNITPTEFKTPWESHVILLKSLAGDKFPLTHTRRYIAHPASATDDNAWSAGVLMGQQEDFTYDGAAELVFQDQNGIKNLFDVLHKPEVKVKIEQDEAGFLDRKKIRAVALGDVLTTNRG